jgi:hypothetical protein
VSSRVLAATLALTLLAGSASSAFAGDPEGARQAYDKASAAFARKSYAEAAAGFSIADDLEPNPVALESALKSAVLADDPVLGMQLVERAASRPSDPRVEAAAKRAREKFAGRAGRLSVTCPDERGCSAKLEGAPLALGRRVWVRPGSQRLDVVVDGVTSGHDVEVAPGGIVDFVPPAPPRREEPTPPRAAPPATQPIPPTTKQGTEQSGPPLTPRENDRGISPAWFVVGAVATAALAGVTIWSGVDTLEKHAAFLEGEDAEKGPGQDAQLRTNILLGATLLSAAGTAITGIFVDWGGPSGSVAQPFPRGVAIQLRY